MFSKKFSRPLTLALALGLGILLSSSSSASAEESDGISVGKLHFGKKTDDKWLTVDLRKTSRASLTQRQSQSGPVVGLNGNAYNVRAVTRSNTRSQYPTSYAASSYATDVVRPNLPTAYPPASTMVSNRKLVQAANIAVGSANGHSTGSCWRYVKSALLKAEAIDSYPKTGYAKQAASELVNSYGFVRTSIINPFYAPVGSVLVYGGNGAGHVEIRTRTGFVSDFVSLKPSGRPLIGVFVKR